MRSIAVVLTFFASVLGFGEAETGWPDLSGTWAMFQTLTDYWDAPLLGERPRRINQIAVIASEQDGAVLILRFERICMMEFDMGTSIVRLSILPEFLQAVGVGPVMGTLSREGARVFLEIPSFIVVNGANLSNPGSDPLPTSPEDPRVVDVDGDGKPGFTVYVRILGFISGETYVVQRLRQGYRGEVSGQNLVRGVVKWEDEQVSLGASLRFFLVSGVGRPDPDPNNSFFVLKRISGKESCDELIELFREELGS